MSGLEVIGAAASIIQIADAGLKLYNYIESVASANKRLTRVNKNLETTCNVVKEIGEVFQRKETAILVSERAVKTAHDAAEECHLVFGELREAVEKSNKNKYIFPLREEKLELLSVQLEKLKSTLMLLMTLLIHARDLQNDNSGRQRDEVHELIRAKEAATVRYEELKRTHDLLVAKLPPASARMPPSFNTFIVDSNGLSRSDQPGTRSPNDKAGGFVPFGQSRDDTAAALEISIRQVSELLKSLKAIKDVIDDTTTLSKAKTDARAAYYAARAILDDLLGENNNLLGQRSSREVYHKSLAKYDGTYDGAWTDVGAEDEREEREFQERMELQRLNFQLDREAKQALKKGNELQQRRPVESRDQRREVTERARDKEGGPEDQSRYLERLKLAEQENTRREYKAASGTTKKETERQWREEEYRARMDQLRRSEDGLDLLLERKAYMERKEMARTSTVTHLKIRSSYLDERTLERFKIPWKSDPTNPEFYIILREMDKEETNALFEHTRLVKQLARPEDIELNRREQFIPSLRVIGHTREPTSKGTQIVEEAEQESDEIDKLLHEWTTLFDDPGGMTPRKSNASALSIETKMRQPEKNTIEVTDEDREKRWEDDHLMMM